MTIKTRLLISAVVCLVIVAGIGAIIILESLNLKERLDQLANSSKIVRRAFDLNILADDYFVYGEERPLQQWKIRHRELGALLHMYSAQDSDTRRIVRELGQEHKEVLTAFLNLVALQEDPRSVESQVRAFEDRKQKLAALLALKLQAMVAAATELEKRSQSQLFDDQRSANFAIIFFVGLMALVAVAIVTIVSKLVIEPLTKLAKSADIIGAGDLDHEVDMKGRGELRHLAEAFNRMTVNLKKSYNELEAEIAHRKQAEKFLARQAEELARSNRDLEQFAYVASHDLQEPLRNVTNCVQLLEKRYKNELGSDTVKLADFAVDSCGRMKDLIDDLLEFSRVGTRGNPLEPTDCEEVLRRALVNLRSTIKESGAVITYDSLPVLNADSTQLSQLFQNLVSNGIKFRGPEPPRVHISAKELNHEWLFSVQDNGMGIDPQYNDRIFVIFQRLHGKSEYPGTGIGLAIAKKIVERHRGRIWAQSKCGEGSTFCFTIPTGAINNGH